MGYYRVRLRIALFGGTFDPIHEGHLTVAREAREAFALDRVLLVPNNRPPHKQGGAQASYAHRVNMAELACADEPGIEVSRLEEGTERSYTIETLLKVRQKLATDDRLFFVIGADAFAEVGTWYRWREVLLLTEFIVVTRPGHEIAQIEGATVHRLEGVAVPYSSSAIRERLAAGEAPEGVARGVLRYIRSHALYSVHLMDG